MRVYESEDLAKERPGDACRTTDLQSPPPRKEDKGLRRIRDKEHGRSGVAE